jgi:hypothetical protein
MNDGAVRVAWKTNCADAVVSTMLDLKKPLSLRSDSNSRQVGKPKKNLKRRKRVMRISRGQAAARIILSKFLVRTLQLECLPSLARPLCLLICFT